ncbi:hypothetical protein CHS0354_001917 [Potamilus streckersoni]|uniref:TIR domain-containing protein n=1 Tax=Potamilus streckersoni TaxID=2493646 RepID=A0AAE0SAU3_9BIVA|nr:hypothetical protein CHS0354_001917 [Potamilus streckersoni]
MTTEWKFTVKELNEAWQSVEIYLSEELYPKNILPILEKISFLSAEDFDDMCKLRRRQIVKELLHRIKPKLPEAFSHLLHALNEAKQDEIVQVLRKYIERTRDSRNVTHDEESNAMVSSINYYKMKLELLKDGCIMGETEAESRAYLNNGRILFSYNMRSQCLTVETGSIIVCLRPLSNLTKEGLLFFVQHDGIRNFVSDLLKRKRIFRSLSDGEMSIHVQLYSSDKDAQSEGADGQNEGYSQIELQESFTITYNPQMIKINLNRQYDNLVEEIDPLLFKDIFITRGILDRNFFDELNRLKRKLRAARFLKTVMAKGSTAVAALVDALRNNELDDLANDLCTVRDSSSNISDEGQVDDSLIEVVLEDSETHDQESKLWSGHFTATIRKNEEGDITPKAMGSNEGIEAVTPETSIQFEQKRDAFDELSSRVTDQSTSEESQKHLQRRHVELRKKYHAFFCYSSNDIQWVKQTVETLEKKHGFICREYDRDNTPGTLLLQFAEDSIRHSYKTVVVMTKEAFQSDFVLHEIEMAITLGFEERRKCVVPVLLEDCEVPHRFKILNYVDARDPEKINIWLPKLVMELET